MVTEIYDKNRLYYLHNALILGYMGDELKAQPPTMTFQDAVDKFAIRTRLLREASENTTVNSILFNIYFILREETFTISQFLENS